MKIKHPENEGHPVFVTSTCFEKAPVFQFPECAELVVEQIDRLRKLEYWWVSEFVVMPEHVHLLVLPVRPLGYCMQEFKKSTARLINRRRGHSGVKIWLDEYHARIGLNEKEYAAKVDYIWWNPVKRRLVETPQAWLYSSAHPSRQTDRSRFY
jgi:putative transposase